ncbi:hypothetical protein D1AOALGA4SA_3765 [Olavius algarvensis Delta 1 endosymbiont]|nr:hypothetical protein D1AOALGA4SA_3765 [Olavius algarvensis Delta 1 endosymbiont]
MFGLIYFHTSGGLWLKDSRSDQRKETQSANRAFIDGGSGFQPRLPSWVIVAGGHSHKPLTYI